MKVKLEVVIELGEMDVGDLATAVKREIRAMDIPNPDGGVMFLEHLSVVVKDVSSNAPALPPINWCRVHRAEALDSQYHCGDPYCADCKNVPNARNERPASAGPLD